MYGQSEWWQSILLSLLPVQTADYGYQYLPSYICELQYMYVFFWDFNKVPSFNTHPCEQLPNCKLNVHSVKFSESDTKQVDEDRGVSLFLTVIENMRAIQIEMISFQAWGWNENWKIANL